MRNRCLMRQKFAGKEAGLSILLIFLIIYIISLIPLAELSYRKLLAHTFITAGFMLELLLFLRPGYKRLIPFSFLFAALALLWAIYFKPTQTLIFVRSATLIALWSALGIEVLGQILKKGPITWHRIRGAACIYLFFGLIMAELYRLVETILPGAFLLPSNVKKDPELLYAQMVYLSFVTQTTLGYGDIIPAHPIARMFVIFQALVGQFYPAVVMAWFVSQEVVHRTGSPSNVRGFKLKRATKLVTEKRTMS